MKVKVEKDDITKSLTKIQENLKRLPQEAYNFWVSKTPKDTGNARRKTSLKGNTIVADYPYADRLDKGWSKQAPDGMSEPTSKFIEKRLKQIMRK